MKKQSSQHEQDKKESNYSFRRFVLDIVTIVALGRTAYNETKEYMYQAREKMKDNMSDTTFNEANNKYTQFKNTTSKVLSQMFPSMQELKKFVGKHPKAKNIFLGTLTSIAFVEHVAHTQHKILNTASNVSYVLETEYKTGLKRALGNELTEAGFLDSDDVVQSLDKQSTTSMRKTP